MTRNRHILPAFTAVLLVVLLGGCSLFNRLFSKSEEVFLGQYVTLPAQLMEEGNTYAWSYAELPEESALQELTPTDSANPMSLGAMRSC